MLRRGFQLLNPKKFEKVSIDLGYLDIVADTTDNGRFYHCPNGKSYPSITTILGASGKDFLVNWRAAVGEEEANRVSRVAASKGEKVHGFCERYLQGLPLDIQMPTHVQAFNAARKVLDPHIDRIYLQEFPLYSDSLGVAGRVDLVAEYDNELAIIDFKTSSRVKKEEDISNYFIQETFYAKAFEERSGIPINKLVTIMLVEGRSDPLVFIQNKSVWEQQLIHAINHYHSTKETI